MGINTAAVLLLWRARMGQTRIKSWHHTELHPCLVKKKKTCHCVGMLFVCMYSAGVGLNLVVSAENEVKRGSA